MKFLMTAAILLLAGCAAGPAIDRSHPAASQDSRVRYIIIHYTEGDFPRALDVLTNGQVSSHYLISDYPAKIYQLVDEDRRAWHAGDSAWKADTQLNFSSIGIEIVNPGYRDTEAGRVYFDYPRAQIDLLVALLRRIVERHQVRPENILGHNEIAPRRKSDPGPRFPWQVLAQAGLVRWPEPERVAAWRIAFEERLPDAAWFRQKLRRHGYVFAGKGEEGDWDAAARQALTAFQMRYRPARYDGMPDAETAALLEVLDGLGGDAAAQLPSEPAPYQMRTRWLGGR
ncbi:N-acetylmuramoyl-L-alanine amidase [Noviherbaspirillum galbum]|uniref:N-acetylmuramoyl-L-alanine amidase n=1 Tax=Noviherbaspirillum galbum TaxID=2709383 RepID=A0A6B3SU10_9BURK|nr:N-acetylmuramoyl-L-alanine amidase [Noviherbaspirillum galbum]NEX64081.1 N-acetylmuramoyl-L-alanine amidase [Noviherbaspirillum galbum]